MPHKAAVKIRLLTNNQKTRDSWFWDLPCPSFPCFLGKRQGKPPKKQGFFIPTEPLKSLEKKGKTLNKTKEILAAEENKEFPKNKEGKDRVQGYRENSRKIAGKLLLEIFPESQTLTTLNSRISGTGKLRRAEWG